MLDSLKGIQANIISKATSEQDPDMSFCVDVASRLRKLSPPQNSLDILKYEKWLVGSSKRISFTKLWKAPCLWHFWKTGQTHNRLFLPFFLRFRRCTKNVIWIIWRSLTLNPSIFSCTRHVLVASLWINMATRCVCDIHSCRVAVCLRHIVNHAAFRNNCKHSDIVWPLWHFVQSKKVWVRHLAEHYLMINLHVQWCYQVICTKNVRLYLCFHYLLTHLLWYMCTSPQMCQSKSQIVWPKIWC